MRPSSGSINLSDQLDDAGGREELAAVLPFRHCEFAQEAFIDSRRKCDPRCRWGSRRSSSAAIRAVPGGRVSRGMNPLEFVTATPTSREYEPFSTSGLSTLNVIVATALGN